MKNRALIILCGSLSLFSLGCQKTGGGASNSPKAAPLSNALSCDVGQAMAKVDSKKLKIESSGPARPGEVVHYKINQDLNCAAKAVTWDIEPSRAPALKSDKMRSVYSWPGEYVVTAKVQTAGEPISLSVRTLVSDEISLSGPQIGMAELDHHFELVVPASLPVENISWNFGDDTDPEAGMGPKDHFYYQPGDYQVIVTITMTDSSTATIVHPIKVIPATDGMECVRDLVISGPSDLMPGQVGTFTAFLPPCLANRVRQVRWNFGDGSLMMAGTSLTHAYDLPGNYTVRVDLFSGENPTPLLTIHRSVFVPAEPTPDPDPIPDPTPEPDPDPTPAICKVGDTRQSDGNTSTEKRECGVGGTKDVTIKERIVEECKLIGGEVPGWMEVSRTREVIGEGECTGQYCELPPGALEGVDAVSGDFFNIGGKWYLPSGITKTFYSNRSPAGSCSEVSERRTCTNGVFSGTSDHVYLSCHNGCEGMGPHGTTKTDVVIGQETVPKMCRFGETGVTDIFQTIADKTCNEGTVETSNTHRGGLLVAGECPTYSWVPTENWTACSADCGGEQKRIYECRSSKGEVAPAERCENAAPVQVRVCDGNPEAVRRSETSTEVEDAGSSGKCPANQIGYTISRREVKTTTTYACIDHSVQSEGTNVETGPWVEEKYCKDYAPHRCSKDPLMTTEETRGRFAWMKKCAPSNAAIREFLDVYDHTGGYLKDLTYKGTIIYASFMNGSMNPERVWKAPTQASASCNVPEGVYVAAICPIDCATPEQPVLVASQQGKLEYVKFEQAWDEKFQFVGSLAARSSLSTRKVVRTPVDVWTQTGEEGHNVLVFRMQSGRSLRLSLNHAVMSQDGSLKAAQDFKVGDSVVQLGGALDAIVSITPEVFQGRVYNVYLQTSEAKRNIVITNGYLTGSAYFAGEGIEQLNRQVLRTSLLRGVFNK